MSRAHADTDDVTGIIARAVQRVEAVRQQRSKAGGVEWPTLLPTPSAVAANERAARSFPTQDRICLGCTNTFASRSPTNRMCERCLEDA